MQQLLDKAGKEDVAWFKSCLSLHSCTADRMIEGVGSSAATSSMKGSVICHPDIDQRPDLPKDIVSAELIPSSRDLIDHVDFISRSWKMETHAATEL